MKFLKIIIFVTIFLMVNAEQKITANVERNYLSNRLNRNKKIISTVKIFQGAAVLETLYCICQLYFNKSLSRASLKHYDNRWTLDSIAIICSYLYLNYLDKENDELEKQIRDLDGIR